MPRRLTAWQYLDSVKAAVGHLGIALDGLRDAYGSSTDGDWFESEEWHDIVGYMGLLVRILHDDAETRPVRANISEGATKEVPVERLPDGSFYSNLSGGWQPNFPQLVRGGRERSGQDDHGDIL